jgi:hypothetical protein
MRLAAELRLVFARTSGLGSGRTGVAVTSSRSCGGLRVGVDGGESVGARRRSGCTVAAGCADEPLLIGQPVWTSDPAADGRGGEHDGQAAFDRIRSELLSEITRTSRTRHHQAPVCDLKRSMARKFQRYVASHMTRVMLRAASTTSLVITVSSLMRRIRSTWTNSR